jgi:hypothetical protein
MWDRLFLTRHQRALVRGFVSLVPQPLHRPWLVQHMLRTAQAIAW